MNKQKFLNILLIILFTQCGDKNQSKETHFLNNEKEESKDISKSEKTTEKISESVGEKTNEIPKNLLTGFRKSSISEKIKVTESSHSPSFELSPNQQEELAQKLLRFVEHNVLERAEKLLSHQGAPVNTIVETMSPYGPVKDYPLRMAVFNKNPIMVALLMMFGADPRLKVNDNSPLYTAEAEAPFLLPILKGVIPPEEILNFQHSIDPIRFISYGKTLRSRYELLLLFNHLGKRLEAENAFGIDPSAVDLGFSVVFHTAQRFIQGYLEKYSTYDAHVSLFEKMNESTLSSHESAAESIRIGHTLQSTGFRNLAQRGINPNFISKNKEGGTLLMIAAREGHLQTAALLLQQGAHPNIRVNGESALEIALQNHRSHIAALLINKITPDEALQITDPNVQIDLLKRQKSKQDLLYMASVLEQALQSHTDLAGFDLIYSFREEDLFSLQVALENGANPMINPIGDIPLTYARNLEQVRLLLKFGADPHFFENSEKRTPYQFAQQQNLKKYIKEYDK